MVSLGFGDTATGGFAEALVYGADNGAQISSNSWGYTSPGSYEQAVLDAIDYYDGAGGIVVFAAGNDDADAAYYPGYYSKAVAVAALDNSAVRASFSNYGSWIDVSAPGVSIMSTSTGNAYGYSDGTSMACPHVAGLLALGWGIDSSLSAAELLTCLYDTATDVDSLNSGYSNKLGAGMVAAEAFVLCARNGAPTPKPTHTRRPTTSAPSFKPTLTPAPTESCGGSCDVVLALVLTTDDYPGETRWSLEMAADTPYACADSSTSGGPYSSANTAYAATVASNLCRSETYTFEMTDSWGDGICCGYGDGGYSLQLDGTTIFTSTGAFGYEETTTFTVDVDTPSPTPRPTPQPTPWPTVVPGNPSAAPVTRAPTSVPSSTPTPAPIVGMTSYPTAGRSAAPTAAPTLDPTTTFESAPANYYIAKGSATYGNAYVGQTALMKTTSSSGSTLLASTDTYVRRADVPRTSRGDAAAATWIFRGDGIAAAPR